MKISTCSHTVSEMGQVYFLGVGDFPIFRKEIVVKLRKTANSQQARKMYQKSAEMRRNGENVEKYNKPVKRSKKSLCPVSTGQGDF